MDHFIFERASSQRFNHNQILSQAQLYLLHHHVSGIHARPCPEERLMAYMVLELLRATGVKTISLGHKKFALAALIGNREWRQTSSVLAQISPSLRPMRSMREEANNDTASWMNRLLRFRSNAPGACLIAGPHTCVEEDGSLSGYDRGTSDSLGPRK